MSTHITQCVVCGKNVYCCQDEHALGAGGAHGEGGCENPPFVEFCSLEHALELQRRLVKSIANYHECMRGDTHERAGGPRRVWLSEPSLPL